jgi:DNA-binding NarL/FixJ family response regulator
VAELVEEIPVAKPEAVSIHVCLVSGRRLIRAALISLLAKEQITTEESVHDQEDLLAFMRYAGTTQCHAVILALAGMNVSALAGARKTLDLIGTVPLVVLADCANRGEVYTALRLGAKAFVSSNSQPEELITAVRIASQGKVYLAPDVAELVVQDISTAAILGGKPRLLTETKLSAREVEVVQLLCDGLSSKAIARRLHISLKTVENHRHNIYLKCEVDNVASLFRYALQNALVTI